MMVEKWKSLTKHQTSILIDSWSEAMIVYFDLELYSSISQNTRVLEPLLIQKNLESSWGLFSIFLSVKIPLSPLWRLIFTVNIYGWRVAYAISQIQFWACLWGCFHGKITEWGKPALNVDDIFSAGILGRKKVCGRGLFPTSTIISYFVLPGSSTLTCCELCDAFLTLVRLYTFSNHKSKLILPPLSWLRYLFCHTNEKSNCPPSTRFHLLLS